MNEGRNNSKLHRTERGSFLNPIESEIAKNSQITETSETCFDAKLEEELKNLRKDVKVPYLPKSTKKYTLVLDLDETLVHLVDNQEEDGSYCYFRPGVNLFLKTLAKHYEIVVFTAAMPDVSQSLT